MDEMWKMSRLAQMVAYSFNFLALVSWRWLPLRYLVHVPQNSVILIPPGSTSKPETTGLRVSIYIIPLRV